MKPTFTQDWFSHAIPNLEVIKNHLPDNKKFLEVGCFEGMATCWMLENMLAYNGYICCIDTFRGSEEHKAIDFTETRELFINNTNEVKKEEQYVHLVIEESSVAMTWLLNSIGRDAECMLNEFDFIYIDASHQASDVLSDAIMGYHLLKPKGIMLFDDYIWGQWLNPLHTPKLAIDMFALVFHGKVNVILVGQQLAVMKA